VGGYTELGERQDCPAENVAKNKKNTHEKRKRTSNSKWYGPVALKKKLLPGKNLKGGIRWGKKGRTSRG